PASLCGRGRCSSGIALSLRRGPLELANLRLELAPSALPLVASTPTCRELVACAGPLAPWLDGNAGEGVEPGRLQLGGQPAGFEQAPAFLLHGGGLEGARDPLHRRRRGRPAGFRQDRASAVEQLRHGVALARGGGTERFRVAFPAEQLRLRGDDRLACAQ